MSTHLVTVALPYANGHLHLGHVYEHIQADIWVRSLRLRDHSCYFVSGSDMHGTPIMLSAQQAGVSAAELAGSFAQAHQADLQGFLIYHDCYHATNTAENKQLVLQAYQSLQKNHQLVEREIAQYYDVSAAMFLPDRYIKGQCPRCHAADQYGDHCEVCGATYHSSELLSPYSTVSKTPPESRQTAHQYFSLSRHQQTLQQWLQQASLQDPVKNKLFEWVDGQLQDWCITRDAPYVGFAVPDRQDKYFYVWLDAPFGYMAALMNLGQQQGKDLVSECWSPDSAVQVTHFIGKDIVNFHGLFWPALLADLGYRLPSSLHVHGYMTLDGEKMSKSRGNFVLARTYLRHLQPDYLRYYLAMKTSPGIEDIDLNWQNFKTRVNADLIGKVINIGSRSSAILQRHFAGELVAELPTANLLLRLQAARGQISRFYEQRLFAAVVKEVGLLADQVNQYIDEHAPWQLVKQPDGLAKAQEVCSMALNAFKILMTYLKPIIPDTADKTEAFMQVELTWAGIMHPYQNRTVAAFARLLDRITDEQLAMLTEPGE